MNGSETLPRARIIRRRTTFDRTRQQGRRINNRWMTLNWLAKEAAEADAATVAFLTPKRLGAATVRNKMRRRMREVYRRHLPAMARNAFVVWIARAPALTLDADGLRKCMLELWGRLP
jgi:ribonuclease P protein component